jgi:hypothetical protein
VVNLVDKTCRNCGKPIVRPAHGRYVPYQHETPSDCSSAVPGPYPDSAALAMAHELAAQEMREEVAQYVREGKASVEDSQLAPRATPPGES